MMSGVLHDLKTPMTIVSGYAQLMAHVRRRRAAQPLRRADPEAVRSDVGDDARGAAVRARRVEPARPQGLSAEVAARGARSSSSASSPARRSSSSSSALQGRRLLRREQDVPRHPQPGAQRGAGDGAAAAPSRIIVDTDGPELTLDFADTGARHSRGDAAGACSRPSPPPASPTAPASAWPSSRRSSTSTTGASATRPAPAPARRSAWRCRLARQS